MKVKSMLPFVVIDWDTAGLKRGNQLLNTLIRQIGIGRVSKAKVSGCVCSLLRFKRKILFDIIIYRIFATIRPTYKS